MRDGAEARLYTLVPTAQLDDADGDRAVVSTRAQGVSVLRLSDGGLVGRFAGTHGTLEGRQLYVAQGRKVVRRTL